MIGLLLGAAHAAPLPVDSCPARTRAAAFDAAVADAEVAVRMLDAGALSLALGRAGEVLPCLEDPLYPDQLARWYRARGIEAVVAGDPTTAESWFRGARDLLPAFRMDDTLGAGILEAWARATPSEGTAALPRADGSWSVDGRAASAAPTDHPWVLQWLGPDGAVRGSAVLDAGVVEPPFGVASASPRVAAAAPAPVPAAPPTRGHASRGLAVGALASGLLAGFGVAQAADWKADVLTSTAPSDEQRGVVTANRVVGYGAGGLAAVSVGLGVSAVAVGRW